MTHIVILSEAIGSGHERAAIAIEESLLHLYPNIHITRLNLLGTFLPVTAKITRTLYLQTIKHHPHWWGKWYEWQRAKEWKGFSRSLVGSLLRKDVVSWLRCLSPDAIVCTHPLPAVLIAEMRKRGLEIPLCSVLTDFDLHGYWTHPEIDVYCVPESDIAAGMRKSSLGRPEVRITGIPTMRAFRETALGRCSHLSKEKKRVLLLGGGLGIGILPVVQEMLKSGMQDDITVICGRNHTLRRELEEKYGSQPNLQIIGYSSQVHQFMARSDLLISKPGGLTVAEALVMRLPMVLYSSIQGQERRNGQLMSRFGVAVTGQTGEEVIGHAGDLLKNQGKRLKMIESMELIRRPYAADDISHTVMELAKGAWQKRVQVFIS